MHEQGTGVRIGFITDGFVDMIDELLRGFTPGQGHSPKTSTLRGCDNRVLDEEQENQ